jgi:hypothetical protein
MHKGFVFGSVAVAVGVAFVGPASADACAAGTTCAVTTIAATVDVGTLAIAALPVSGSLTFTNVLPAAGATQDLQKGADLTLTTVTDTRLAGTAWSVTANVSEFSDGAAPTPHLIPRSALKLSVPGAPLKVLGAAGMTIDRKGTATAVNGTSGDLAGLVSASATGGLNTVEYTPHIDITVPAGTPAGTYTGVLTQSVA